MPILSPSPSSRPTEALGGPHQTCAMPFPIQAVSTERRGTRAPARLGTRIMPAVLPFLLATPLVCAARAEPANPVVTKEGAKRTMSPSAPFDFIVGWILLKDDLEYLCQAIDRAADHGVNHIQLSHSIIHHADQLFSQEGLPDKINTLTQRIHKHGIQAFIWTHELRRVPSRLARDGKVQLDKPQLWQWLRDRYEKVFKLCPEIDGLVLTFHETDVSVYDDNRVSSRMPKSERVTKLIDALHAVCRDHDKQLIVRTFVYWPGELENVTRGIQATDPAVIVMSKEVPHDWQPNYPNNPAIGAFPGRRQIVEFDLGHEYYGQNLVPYLLPAYLKNRLTYQRSKGVAGAATRISRDGHSILGTVSELNLAAFREFCNNAGADERSTWHKIVTRRYGQAAAKPLADILQRTADVVERTLLTRGYYFLNNHSRIPHLHYAEYHVASHSIAKWIPTDQERQREQSLREPTVEVHRAVVAEKNEAVRIAEQLLRDLESLTAQIKPADFAQLRTELVRLRDLAKLYRITADAYFAYQVHRRHPAEVTRSAVEKKLADMDAAVGWLKQEYPRDFLLNVGHLQHLGKEIRGRLVKGAK